MSLLRQPLSGDPITPLTTVSLNSSITNVVLDSDAGDSSVLLRTDSNPGIYIDKYQNVGINTTAPYSQLDINSSNGACLRMIYNNTSNYCTINTTSSGNMLLSSGGEVTVDTGINFNVKNHNGLSSGLYLNDSLVTSTSAQLNYTDVTPGTATASKSLVLDVSKDIATINSLTATYITGTLQTAAQTNITSVGTLTSLSTGNITLNGTLITSTAAQLNYCSVTTAGTAEASKSLVLDASSNIIGINSLTATTLITGSTTINETQLGYINVTPGTAAASKALVLDASKNIATINLLTATSITGTLQTATQTNITSLGTLTSLATGNITLNGTLITSTAAQLNYCSVTTAGTAEASKSLVLDASSNITGINSLTATTLITGSTTINETQLGYINVTPGTAAASKALVLDVSKDIATINSLTATSITGTLQTATQTNITSVGTLTSLSTGNITLNGTLIASTATQLNYTNVTPGTATASKALVLDSSSDITGINSLTATTIIAGSTTINETHLGYLNVTPGTATASKSLVLDASSNITGINSLTATTIVVGSSSLNETQLGYLDVTPGTATASKVLVLDSSKNISGINDITAETLTLNGTDTSILNVLDNTMSDMNSKYFRLGKSTTSGENLLLRYLYISPVTLSKAYIGLSSNASALTIDYNGNIDINYHDGSKGLELGGTLVTATATQLNYTNVTPGTAAASKSLVLDASSDITGINSLTATTIIAGSTTINETHLGYLDVTPGTATASKALVLDATSNITGINSLTATTIVVGSSSLNETQLGYLDVTPGTATASKALVLDASSNISGIDDITAESLTLTGDGSDTPILALDSSQANGTYRIFKLGRAASTNNSANMKFYYSSSASVSNWMGLGVHGYDDAIKIYYNYVNITKTLKLAGVSVTSTSDQLNYTNVTPGTATASKSLVLDASSNITGINSLTATTIIAGSTTINETHLGYLDVTPGTATASKSLVLDASSNITGINSLTASTIVVGSSSLNETQLGYLDITPGTATASKALVLDASSNITGIDDIGAASLALTGDGTDTPLSILDSAQPSSAYRIFKLGYADSTSNSANMKFYYSSPGSVSNWMGLGLHGYDDTIKLYYNQVDITKTLKLSGTAVTATASELNYCDVTAGTATASKAIVLDASKDITGIGDITATKLTLNDTADTPLVILDNTMSAEAKYIRLGKETASRNSALIKYYYSSNDSASNYLSLGLHGYTAPFEVFYNYVDITSLYLNGTAVTASAAELNYCDVTAGTAAASKALVLNVSKDITGIRVITAEEIIVSGNSTTLISALYSSQPSGTYKYMYLGKSTSLYESMVFSYYYNTTSSARKGFIGVAGKSSTIALEYDGSVDISYHNGSTLGLKLAGSLVTSTAAQLNYCNVTAGTATASKSLVLDASSNITGINSLTATTIVVGSSSLNETQLGYLDVTAGTATASKALVLDSSKDISGIGSISAETITLNGSASVLINALDSSQASSAYRYMYLGRSGASLESMIFSYYYNTASSSRKGYMGLAGKTQIIALEYDGSVNINYHNASTIGLKLGGSLVTSTAAQLNYCNVTAGTATASKALVLDASSNISGINSLTATTIVVGSSSLNETQLGYLDVTPGTATASKSLVLDASSDIAGINTIGSASIAITGDGTDTPLSILDSTLSTAQSRYLKLGKDETENDCGIMRFYHLSSGSTSNYLSFGLNSHLDVLKVYNSYVNVGTLRINGTAITATAAEINYNDVTPGTATASKALVLDSNKNIATINSLTATLITGTLQTAAQTNITSVGTLTSLTTGTTIINSSDQIPFKLLDSSMGIADASYMIFGKDETTNDSGVFKFNHANEASSANYLDMHLYDSLEYVRVYDSYVEISTLRLTGTLRLSGTEVTATAAELNYCDVTPGTATASKSLVLDASSNITGINSLTATTIIAGSTTINETQLGYLDVTPGTATASKALVLDASSNITGINSLTATTIIAGSTTINETQLGYLDVTPGTAEASKSLVLDASKDIAGIGDVTAESIILNGTTITPIDALDGTMGDLDLKYLRLGKSNSTGEHFSIRYIYRSTVVDSEVSLGLAGAATSLYTLQMDYYGNVNIYYHNGSDKGLKLGDTLVTSTADQLNYCDVTAGTATASKSLVLDASSNITGINSLTASTIIAGSTTINETHLGYLDVTPGTATASKSLVLDASSNITGINSLTASTIIAGSTTINETHLGYLDVTPGTATASKSLVLDASSNITGINSLTATTIVVGSSSLNETQLGYLDITPGTAAISKALVLDASKNIATINSLTATSITGTLQTSLQPNISSVGDSGLTITGNSSNNILLCIDSSIGDGDERYFKMGRSLSYLDSADIKFHYNSIGSASNYISFGFYGIGGVLTMEGDKSININYHDGSSIGLKLGGSLVTSTAAELNYNDVTPGTATASKSLVLDASKNIATINSLTATSITGTLQTAAQTNITSVGTLTSLSTGNITLNGTLITSTATELNYNDVTPGTATASKALVLDASKDITGIGDITAETLTLNGSTSTLLNALDSTQASGAYRYIYLGKSSSTLECMTFSYYYNTTTSSRKGYIGLMSKSSTIGLEYDGSVNINYHNGSTIGLKLGGTLVTSTAAQLNYCGVTPGTATASKSLVLDASKNIATINSLTATSITGTLQTATQTNITSVGTLTSLSTGNITLNGTLITSTATELNYCDVTTIGTGQASKALVLDASRNITNINSLTAAAHLGNEINLTTTDTTPFTCYNSSISSSGGQQILQWGKSSATDCAASIRYVNYVSTSLNKMTLGVNGTNSYACQIYASGAVDIAYHNGSTGLKLGGTLVTATAAELNYCDVTAGAGTASKALVLDSGKNISGIDDIGAASLALTGDGTDTPIQALDSAQPASAYRIFKLGRADSTANSANMKFYYVSSGSASNWMGIGVFGADDAIKLYTSSVDITKTLKLLGTTVTATATELNYCDVTPGTATASKALVLDSGKDITGIGSISCENIVCTSTTTSKFGTTNSTYLNEFGHRSNLLTGLSSYYYYNSNGNSGSIPTPGGSADVSIRTSGRILCAGEIDITSSRDIKKNITSFDNNQICNFVDYMDIKKFNKNEETRTTIGVIAQDCIVAGIPEIVSVIQADSKDYHDIETGVFTPAGSRLTVNYNAISCISLQMTKILKDENKQIKNELQQMKDENKQMKEENNQMKNENNQMKNELQQIKEELRQIKELLKNIK